MRCFVLCATVVLPSPSVSALIKDGDLKISWEIPGRDEIKASWYDLQLDMGDQVDKKKQACLTFMEFCESWEFLDVSFQNRGMSRIWLKSCLTLSQMWIPLSRTGWGWGQRSQSYMLGTLNGVNGVPFLVSVPQTQLPVPRSFINMCKNGAFVVLQLWKKQTHSTLWWFWGFYL